MAVGTIAPKVLGTDEGLSPGLAQAPGSPGPREALYPWVSPRHCGKGSHLPSGLPAKDLTHAWAHSCWGSHLSTTKQAFQCSLPR